MLSAREQQEMNVATWRWAAAAGHDEHALPGKWLRGLDLGPAAIHQLGIGTTAPCGHRFSAQARGPRTRSGANYFRFAAPPAASPPSRLCAEKRSRYVGLGRGRSRLQQRSWVLLGCCCASSALARPRGPAHPLRAAASRSRSLQA